VHAPDRRGVIEEKPGRPERIVQAVPVPLQLGRQSTIEQDEALVRDERGKRVQHA
jgi:hypothetical protein